MAESPVRTLLAGAIDYAGLFPPASLPMEQAVRNYAAYRWSDDAWALGRFIVPIARLDEFRENSAGLLPARPATPWQLSVLAGAGGADEWTDVAKWTPVGAVVDALELRVATATDISSAAARLPRNLAVFYEIPVEPDPAPLIGAIAAVRGKAKVRTGGVTAEAFPTAAALGRFIVRCAAGRVSFKATAGLHHPLRATYRLTYDPSSASGEMFGFLNVLLAAAFARTGLDERAVAELLVERDAAALRFTATGVEWRGRGVTAEDLCVTRGTLALAFGSCSFREPIEELKAFGLL